ncbi:MAG: threonine ammonia-lyase [Methanoregulaceae archaeon]|jgi:threonine dehydratase|nr:threonine ammonia-lyase [Methanoregulaceae archaeon]
MPTLIDIREASERVRDRVIRTPLVYSPTFSGMTGAEVYLKLECMQKGGSFKVRGATNRVLARRDEIGQKGVIAASAGNHAQGVALAARLAGVPVTIVMPEWVSISKEEATRGYGASVVLAGTTLAGSITIAEEMAAREGMTFIHPYDDDAVIAGQGTIGIEILEDLPEVDLVVVPVGGGGLIAGIALAVKGIRQEARVIGVQAEACPSALEALMAGQPVLVPDKYTIADGIRVRQAGELTFPVIRDYVDEVVTVPEEAVLDAMLELLERKKVVAEGAGAVGLAALVTGSVPVNPGERVVVVISGGNVDTALLERVIRRGRFRSGRILQFTILLEDVSGTLSGLLSVLACEKANILHVVQARSEPVYPIQFTRVEVEVETRGPAHIERIRTALEEAGYRIRIAEYAG